MADNSNETARTGWHELVQAFDAFCGNQTIRYFAMEDTLVGAVSYGDFLPDAQGIQLGMLRGEFQKLRAAAGRDGIICAVPGATSAASPSPAASPAAAASPAPGATSTASPATGAGTLRLHHSFDGAIRHFIHLESPDGTARDIAELHVFDAVTDDINLTTWQRFREELWCKAGRKLPAPLADIAARRVDSLARMYARSPHDEVSLMLERRRRRYPLAALRETRTIPFGTGSISIPADTRSWIESDAESEMRRIRHVQADSLKILVEVDRVCRENGIGYFLCAGTLLGALRYGGFIPWDDDIDIGMMREDYERFLACAPGALAEGFLLQTRATDPDIEYLYSKVRLAGTSYATEWTRYRNEMEGISLDIFPFDRASVESPAFEAYAKEAQRLVLAHRSAARHRVTDDFPHRRARTPMEALGHAVMARRNKPYDAARLARTQRAYEEHVTKFNRDAGATHAVSHVAYLTYLPLADLLPYGEVEFEGMRFSAPRNPDPLMRMQFGDYLAEPPAHQRHGHSVVRWRTSDGACG